MTALQRICLIGPVPPPFTGMSVQIVRWTENLRAAGHAVRLVSTRHDLHGRPVRRALAFLLPLLPEVLRCDVLSVHTGSHISFHAFCTPAVLLGRMAGRRVLVTYKGGEAGDFLSHSRAARCVLRLAHARLVPSPYLQEVLGRFGLTAQVVPNILEPAPLPQPRSPAAGDAVLLVTRNLEPVYSVQTALEAHALVRREIPGVRLEVLGDGSERPRLEQLVSSRGWTGVTFHGNVPPAAVRRALQRAALVLNPSTVDNTPNSLLEALQAGVPIVSTGVGGIPFLVSDGVSALLVPARDPGRMAEAALRILRDPALGARLAEAGQEVACGFLWPAVYARFRGALEPA